MILTRIKAIDKEQLAAGLSDWFDQQAGTPESVAAGLAFDLTLAVQRRRRELGLKYDDLAAHLGVSRAYISKLLGGGENSTLLTLVRLAQAEGCGLELRLAEPAGKPAADVGTVPAQRGPQRQPAQSPRKTSARPRVIPRNPKRIPTRGR
jgi:transcriptional regulator with XRE-family HTH domain